MVECEICLDELHEDEKLVLTCGHEFHSTCVVETLVFKLKRFNRLFVARDSQHSLLALGCPRKGCEHIFDHDELHAILPKDHWERYLENKFVEYLAQRQGSDEFRCPNEECDSQVLHPPASNDEPGTCPKCGARVCMACWRLIDDKEVQCRRCYREVDGDPSPRAHTCTSSSGSCDCSLSSSQGGCAPNAFPEDAVAPPGHFVTTHKNGRIQIHVGAPKEPHEEESEEESVDNEDREFLALMKDNGYRKCSSCGAWVERRIGCGLLVCLCGHRFCYFCGQDGCSCPGVQFHGYMPDWWHSVEQKIFRMLQLIRYGFWCFWLLNFIMLWLTWAEIFDMEGFHVTTPIFGLVLSITILASITFSMDLIARHCRRHSRLLRRYVSRVQSPLRWVLFSVTVVLTLVVVRTVPNVVTRTLPWLVIAEVFGVISVIALCCQSCVWLNDACGWYSNRQQRVYERQLAKQNQKSNQKHNHAPESNSSSMSPKSSLQLEVLPQLA